MIADLNQLLDISKKAAVDAGKEILKIYRSDDFAVELKGDNSPLTRADKKAHEVIVEGLSSTDIPVLSEEGKDIPFETRKNWDYFWMVDPLDGTKEFVKRNGEFTVNIALIHENRSILGVVYAPVLNKLYFASADSGAFLKSEDGLVQLNAQLFSMTDDQLNVVASRSHLNEATENFLSELSKPSIVSMGSSLKFLLVAEGKAHLYPRYAPTMEWDTAAAQIIVEEAGGKVIQEPSGNQVIYNKENLLNPYFLCRGKLDT